MRTIVIDDHLLREILTGARPRDLDGVASGLATTGLWLFRLSSAFADPARAGKLSAPVAGLSPANQAAFRAQLTRLPDEIEVLHLRDLAWPMATLQHRHRSAGHNLSTLAVEALAAAEALDAGIAVSALDVGPALRGAASDDDIEFHVL